MFGKPNYDLQLACSIYGAYLGLPADPKDSLGNLSRIKKLIDFTC